MDTITTQPADQDAAAWWTPYLAKYVAHVGGVVPTRAVAHHFHAFMLALARKFDAQQEWPEGGREVRWFVEPPEIAPRRCYLPGFEPDSVALCSFLDALESLTAGRPVSKVDDGGNSTAAHHDPIATLFAIARERGEDTDELSRIVASHAVASRDDSADCTSGAEQPASSPPPAYIPPQRRSPRRRSTSNPPRVANHVVATGDIFDAA